MEYKKKPIWTVFILLSLVILAAARPQEFGPRNDDDNHDQADDRKGADPARVQIKVYRGPTKNDGSAPWGFWVKQPSDEQ